jgi:hypothetical protein
MFTYNCFCYRRDGTLIYDIIRNSFEEIFAFVDRNNINTYQIYRMTNGVVVQEDLLYSVENGVVTVRYDRYDLDDSENDSENDCYDTDDQFKFLPGR